MSDTAIRRIFGPPGTGKTTTLADRVGRSVAAMGGDGIRIASFSRTAAAEIGSRDAVRSALPRGAVGTMHHHAYAAIDHPPLAVDTEVVTDWNDRVGPTWKITGQRKGGRGFESRDRAGAGAGITLETGDGLLEQLDLLRSTWTPPEKWPRSVQEFAREWADWKRSAGTVDFCDLIIQARRQALAGQPMPGNPHLIVVDEAQDMTPAEIGLALAWGAHLDPDQGERLVFALDDDQAIMEWRGGDPQRILGLDLADWQSEVLAQSYRVPPVVHACAEQWIARCSARYAKEYRPRAATDRDPDDAHAAGWAQRVGFSLDSTQLLDQIEADLEDPALPAEPEAAVMVIASCGYMLTELIAGLRRRGIPFHNPFRDTEAAWNPLGSTTGTPTSQKIYRYGVVRDADLGSAARRWTGEDMRLWMDLVNAKAAHLRHGAKKDLASLPDGQVPPAMILDLWRDTPEGDDALSRATRGDLDWLSSVITEAGLVKRAAYPLEIARQRGIGALAHRPRVVVGTIHSTKGAQSSHVYLAPDVSAAGMRQWNDSTAGRDQLHRLFYVGLTRAYHGVSILLPTSRNAVHPANLVPADLEVRR